MKEALPISAVSFPISQGLSLSRFAVPSPAPLITKDLRKSAGDRPLTKSRRIGQIDSMPRMLGIEMRLESELDFDMLSTFDDDVHGQCAIVIPAAPDVLTPVSIVSSSSKGAPRKSLRWNYRIGPSVSPSEFLYTTSYEWLMELPILQHKLGRDPSGGPSGTLCERVLCFSNATAFP